MNNERLDGLSLDVEQADRDKLRTVFPGCFTDGRLDIDKLLNMCGEYISDDFEKYEFRWKGKAEALQLAGKRSTATLRPCRAESVDWENTRNVYIEGDNLEVLKLLQTSYSRKVKMIYIDPPYNTGNDFVYADDFADPLTRYKEVTAQTTKSNPETMGRFHTNWLNMMWPRLRLAANLLRDDGVIFISIDDNEVHNLRKLCDEVFGEENFITEISWEKRYTRNNDAKLFSTVIDYVVVYRKSDALATIREPRTEKNNESYSNPDNDPRGVWTSVSIVGQRTREERPNLCYEIVNPINGKVVTHATNAWKYSYDAYEKLRDENRLYWGANGENQYPRLKRFLSELEGGIVPTNLWNYKETGTIDTGSKEVEALIGRAIFPYPKPVSLLVRLMKMVTGENDIVLDFFSGSATTAHAVMQLNAEDSGNRRFILVQLPEVTDEKSEAAKAGYANICEIGKERIRRAGKELTSRPLGRKLDVGFRVFKLDSSNLRLWDSTPIRGYGKEAEEELYQRLIDHLEILKPDRSEEDVTVEVMLKLGQDLCEVVRPLDINGKTVYGVGAEVKFIVCLAPDVQPEDAKAMAAYAPGRIIFADSCFYNTEQKSNVRLTLKDKGITIKTL